MFRPISRSHGFKNRRIWPRLGVSGLKLQSEFTNGYEMLHKAWRSIEEVPYCFFKVIHQISRSHGSKNRRIWPRLGVSGLKLQVEFTNGYEMLHKAWSSIEDMMTSSNGNIFRVTGPLCGEFTGPSEVPAQRPVTQSFDVFFDLRLNKRLSKQSWGWWFETPSWSLWRHCNGGALLFFKVIRQISRSHGSTNRQIWSKLGVSGL